MTHFKSKMLRRILLLIVIVLSGFSVTNTNRACAKGGACCSFCNPIWSYCASLTYPNENYRNQWACIVSNGGEDCEVCNPTC